jgi:uncharacterized membrane protein
LMRRHPKIPHPAECDSWQLRMADRVSAVFGTMGMFWALVAWQLIWMALATAGVWLFAGDHYPFPFLLFCSNLVQLWALPVLGVATNRADAKRTAKAETDHQALAYLAHHQDEIHAELRAIRDALTGREQVR